ncbi:MAG: hypothetical protein LBU81_06505 [Methanosarcinales archaeon]|nr:hypothetical protein [Methanosarcinales archaeon]
MTKARTIEEFYAPLFCTKGETVTVSREEFELLRDTVEKQAETLAYVLNRLTAVEFATGVREISDLDSGVDVRNLIKRHGINQIKSDEELILGLLSKRRMLTIVDLRDMFALNHNEKARRLMKRVAEKNENVEISKTCVNGRSIACIKIVDMRSSRTHFVLENDNC